MIKELQKKVQEIFSGRSDVVDKHDPWRYGDQLSEKCDKIEYDYIKTFIDSDVISILDLGCGTGRHIEYIASDFSDKQLYGIDISPGAIKFAESNVKDAIFKVGSFLDFDKLLDYKYDMIIGIGICQYVIDDDDLKEFIMKCKNRLNPGGKIIFKIPIANADTILTNKYSDLLKSEYISKYRNFKSMMSIIKDLNMAINIKKTFADNLFQKSELDVLISTDSQQYWFVCNFWR